MEKLEFPVVKKFNLRGIKKFADWYNKHLALARLNGNKEKRDFLIISAVMFPCFITKKRLRKEEIKTICRSFDSLPKTGLPRFLAIETLLAQEDIRTVVVGNNTYETKEALSLFEYGIMPKREIEKIIEICGNFSEPEQGGYLFFRKVTSKITTGFCRHCIGHEVNVLKEEKIARLSEIKKIKIKKQCLEIIMRS